MPPVSPISPSTASTGGLPSFVGSGTTSSVFSHDQAGYITYKVVDDMSLAGTRPETCVSTRKFIVQYSVTVEEEIFDWNFSSASGLIDTYTCMSATVNSYDSSTGLGTSGYIHFAAGGYTHATSPTQPTYHHTSNFSNILIDSPIGLTSERADDAVTLNAFVALMNTNIRQGGLQYSPNSSSDNVLTTEPEYGWETRLLCP